MLKPAALLLLLFAQTISRGQHNILLFRKKNRTISSFTQGSVISFMTPDRAWHKGEITRLSKDSFCITPRIKIYNLYGTSTITFNTETYALHDIYAMPNKGILIDFKDNRFQVSRTGGHVHWYWVKSGWLFRTGAIGYTALNTFNAVRNKDFSISKYKTPLLAAGTLFAGGVVLHKTYKPFILVRKRHHIQFVQLSD